MNCHKQQTMRSSFLSDFERERKERRKKTEPDPVWIVSLLVYESKRHRYAMLTALNGHLPQQR